MAVALRIRITAKGLRRKARKLDGHLEKHVEAELRRLALEAVRLWEETPKHQLKGDMYGQLGRKLRRVFEPVKLKHQRRERWPNLREIYNARIVRGQSTYQGRRIFYVDEHKEEALFEMLASRAIAKRKDKGSDTYDVRFRVTRDKKLRIEVIRRGRGKVPPVVVAFVRQQMQTVATSSLRKALQGVELA